MESRRSPLFTVFTPTFNRAHTLHRVYDSLSAQTCRDFEWLIVDDGSSDGTRALVDGWIADATFPIRYVSKPNGGKHTAWNLGVQRARGLLFLGLDSDDACVPDALEVLAEAWFAIPESRLHQFTGVCALVMDQRGQLVGEPFPADPLDSDSNELLYRYGVVGEKWGLHRTDVLRQFPFPELEGVSYVPESIVWQRIARRYKQRYINSTLRIYFSDDCDASLTAAPIWTNARAKAMGNRAILDENLDWFWNSPQVFLKAAANLSRTSWHAREGLRRQWSQLSARAARALWLIMLPIGAALYWRDCLRRRRAG